MEVPPSVWGVRSTHQGEALLPQTRNEERALCGGGVAIPHPEWGLEREVLDNPGTQEIWRTIIISQGR